MPAAQKTAQTAPVDKVDDAVQTENTAEVNETEQQKQALLANLGEWERSYLDRLTKFINDYNATSTELDSLSRDPAKIAETTYDTLKSGEFVPGVPGVTEDVVNKYDQIVKAYEQYLGAFRKAAEEYAKTKATEGVDETHLNALTTKRDELDAKIKKLRPGFLTEVEGGEILLPSISGKRGGPKSGQGSGGVKLRGFKLTVDGTVALISNNKGEKVSNFTAASQQSNVPTTELQKAYFTAINATADNYKEKIPNEPVTLNLKGSDGNDHVIVIEKVAG